MRFHNRVDAGRQLAGALLTYRDSHPLVLAIPRGGVPLGRIVADALDGDLDVVLVRKLGAPYNPEFAVGSIGESGKVFIAEYAKNAGADSRYLAEEAKRQMATIQRRRIQYNTVHEPVSISGRTVIVIDDGLATGATMRSALQEVSSLKPKHLVCAVPVASPNAVSVVRTFCDDLVCLEIEADFGGVGQFYDDFCQVEDEEAMALLRC